MKQAYVYLFASMSFLLAADAPASGQSEAVLRRFFEGREVVVKMDMPGDKSGVDVHPESSRPVDYPKVGDRLRGFGIALYKGDAVMVTLVKVKSKNIEFHLGVGGAKESGGPHISTYVPKSNREKRLEDAYDEETDPARKKRLKEDLDDERSRRRYEEERRRRDAEQARQIAKANERELRAQGGSRFNLWYDAGVPVEALTPESVMRALADYVEFPEAANANASPSSPSQSLPNPLALRKGMTEKRVIALFGNPETRIVQRAAGIEVIQYKYSLTAAELSVQFVGGVLVQYVLTSQ